MCAHDMLVFTFSPFKIFVITAYIHLIDWEQVFGLHYHYLTHLFIPEIITILFIFFIRVIRIIPWCVSVFSQASVLGGLSCAVIYTDCKREKCQRALFLVHVKTRWRVKKAPSLCFKLLQSWSRAVDNFFQRPISLRNVCPSLSTTVHKELGLGECTLACQMGSHRKHGPIQS